MTDKIDFIASNPETDLLYPESVPDGVVIVHFRKDGTPFINVREA